MSITNAKILYAEDDNDDRIFLSEFVEASGIHAEFIYVSDGDEAISYLEKAEQQNFPALILLDMNMPKRDGKQTLQYIKKHPLFYTIPVIILSTSDNRTDVEYCKRMGAATYLKKPSHFKGYEKVVKSFIPYLPLAS